MKAVMIFLLFGLIALTGCSDGLGVVEEEEHCFPDNHHSYTGLLGIDYIDVNISAIYTCDEIKFILENWEHHMRQQKEIKEIHTKLTAYSDGCDEWEDAPFNESVYVSSQEYMNYYLNNCEV